MTDDVPELRAIKPLLSGSIPMDQLVQTLEKVKEIQAVPLSPHGSFKDAAGRLVGGGTMHISICRARRALLGRLFGVLDTFL